MTVEATIEELRGRAGEGETIPIIDPVTEQPIAEFADGGANAIDEAVARARKSFDSGVWHQKPQSEQAQVLWRGLLFRGKLRAQRANVSRQRQAR